MRYPIVLLIPVLMLVDYYLTIAGVILYRRKYGQHYKLPQYELNPIWQSDIGKQRWINLRFLVIVLVVTVLFILLGQMVSPENSEAFQIPLGMLFTIYGLIIGRHLSNILIFRYAAKHPSAMTGELRITQEMALKLSQYSTVMVALPVLAITLATRTPFAWGSLTGIIVIGLVHYVWLWRQKRSAL
jgi:uncharacterized membrane protein